MSTARLCPAHRTVFAARPGRRTPPVEDEAQARARANRGEDSAAFVRLCQAARAAAEFAGARDELTAAGACPVCVLERTDWIQAAFAAEASP